MSDDVRDEERAEPQTLEEPPADEAPDEDDEAPDEDDEAPDEDDEAPDEDDEAPDEDDEPIPETVNDPETVADPEAVDDPEMAAPPTVARGRRWLLFAAVMALLTGVAGWAYFGLWKYEPTALSHVPQGSNIVIRAEATKVLLFKPVRKHIWPLLFEGRSDGRSEGDDGRQSKRIARIAEETGVEIPTDLRELVVASMDGTAWVAIVGGQIEPGRFVSGLHTVLSEEGLKSWSRDGDLLVHTSGACLAQAEDGTLVIGTHREIVEAAVPRSEPDDSLPVPSESAIGFRLSHTAFKHVLSAIPDNVPAEPLFGIDELSGQVELADEPHLTLAARPKSTTSPADLASALSGMFTKLGLVLLLVPHDLYGAKSAISNAQVTASKETVQVDAPWPYEPLDQAVQLLAEALSKSKPRKP